MANVILPESFTSFVTNAFCNGETRQQITAAQDVPNFKKLSFNSADNANDNDRPSMTKPISASTSAHCFAITKPSSICFETASNPWVFISSLEISPSDSSLTNSSTLITFKLICGVIKEHAEPMLIAVSCLSPVSTQTAIPARINCSIQRGTPIWSLSSIAVAPTNSKSFSMSSATASNSSSRFFIAWEALMNFLFHASYSLEEISLCAKHKVLKPQAA
mmetsp:Transcript_7779/g.25706  ORF Transcript_7779/g.25706 Transcript_7779/m.25706 type:complete len:219 (-) Transcript_7779:2338-2994(-)